ncbi:MAG TPA: hypothetical protein VGO71_14745 [Baekduia sp.]|jgi:hypothetical protein|nr:hypothetical protein [Baekduia sp.]
MTPRHLKTLAAQAARIGVRLADGAFMAWRAAQIECDLALSTWHAAEPWQSALAHGAYQAALDREEAAARHLEELCRLTGALGQSESATPRP